MKRILGCLLAASMILGTVGIHPQAEANNGLHKGHYKHYSRDRRYYYDDRRHSWFDTKTGKIVKGSLVGAGIGAGAGYLLDKPVGKGAVLGAGLGAGVQATRYSRTLNRHPVAKTAAYGTIAGVGVNALRKDASLTKGALLGGAIGTGVGALRHLD